MVSASEGELNLENEALLFRGPAPHEIADTTNRFYCVWKLSQGNSSCPGIHWGRNKQAYLGLVKLNGNSVGGLRWKRTATYQEALALYHQGRKQHGLCEVVNHYFWQ